MSDVGSSTLRLVELDVANRFAGLVDSSAALAADEPGFRLNADVHGGFSATPGVEVLGLPDETVQAVVWEWGGVHVGSIFGEAPTGRTVVVRGITMVRTVDGSVQSIVDWLSVASQIGLQLNGRSTRQGPSTFPIGARPRGSSGDGSGRRRRAQSS